MNVSFNYLSAVESVMGHLQKGKESCYFLLTIEDSIKLKQIVDLCYIGDHQVIVSFWDRSFQTIAFKVQPSNTLDRSKPKLRLLPCHAEQLQGIFEQVLCFNQTELDFMKSRNYLI